MPAVERFVVLYAIAPVYLLLFPIAVYLLGWPLALRMTALQVLVSLTIFENRFYSWQQLPFTCSYSPSRRPLVAIVASYFAIVSVVMPIITVIVRAGAEFNALFLFYCPIFVALWIWARRRRLEGWGEANLQYEDLPAGTPNLGISELEWGHHREVEP